MAEASRRELIEKAWEEAEKDEGSESSEPEQKVAASEQVEEKASEPEKVEEKTSTETLVDADKESKAAYSAEKKAAEAREQPSIEGTQTVSDRPPVAWKPAQREQWTKLPAEVRQEITRREREIQEGLKQTEGVRKFANDFAQVIQPYSHLIAQQGSTPLRAVDNLMRTAAGLQTGSPEQKAQIVAEIIGNYGIDLQTLDRVLSSVVQNGRVPPKQPQMDQPPAWARPMFEFMQDVQTQRQQYTQRIQTQVQSDIEKAATKPFFEDLREDMADLMEVAGKRGIEMTLDQAYERAVALRPDIQGILKQRKDAESARNPISQAAATLARARKAASTVNGAPTGAALGGHKSPTSRREAIEQAWEAAEGR